MPEPTLPRPPVGDPGNPAFLLSGLGRIVREEIERELRRHGLGLRHLSALGHLSHEPGLSYSELGRRAGVTAQSMQATLGQLEDRGAVERVTLPGRGRTAQLHVTPVGAALLASGRAAVSDVDARLLGDLGPTERQQLTELLLRALSSTTRHRDGRTAL